MSNIKASVLIASHNNGQFIHDCLKSLKEQTYKNIEIILFDDCSQDNSVEEVKKFSNINLIINTKNSKFGSYNQMNAYKSAFKKSSGQVIFFLDSDDYFCTDKIEKVVNQFILNKQTKIIFDLPIYEYENKNKNKYKYINYKNKKFLKNYWPFIFPQSCISIRRECIEKVFEENCFESFSNIWMDFRISVYSKFILKDLFILKKNLTYYRQSNLNISSKFKFLGKSWWKRRFEAHKFIKFFFKKNNISHFKNLDYLITSLINKII